MKKEYGMSNMLPQKHEEMVRALTPYVSEQTASGQMALITIEPALPCFICGEPATEALIAPAREYEVDHRLPWLTFPICPACEERQVWGQPDE
jgi:hypothetical protein